MSNVTEIKSEEDFRAFVKQPKAVLAFTVPSRCAPCRALEPRYNMAASQTEVPFGTIDSDVFPEIAAEYLIQGIPTVLVYESGDATGKISGRTGAAILSELE